MSLIVRGDWSHARKYFSLSEKYAAFRDFTTPGRGIGLHALVVDENTAFRLTQAEVESHPDWRGFAEAADSHRRYAACLRSRSSVRTAGTTDFCRYRDKVDGGDFGEDDDLHLQRLAGLAALALDALASVRKLRGGEEVPILEREPMAAFVHIESV